MFLERRGEWIVILVLDVGVVRPPIGVWLWGGGRRRARRGRWRLSCGRRGRVVGVRVVTVNEIADHARAGFAQAPAVFTRRAVIIV